MAWKGLLDAAPDDPRVFGTMARERAIHTFGNLTLLTQALNSPVSNGEWAAKKPALLEASLLPVARKGDVVSLATPTTNSRIWYPGDDPYGPSPLLPKLLLAALVLELSAQQQIGV